MQGTPKGNPQFCVIFGLGVFSLLGASLLSQFQTKVQVAPFSLQLPNKGVCICVLSCVFPCFPLFSLCLPHASWRSMHAEHCTTQLRARTTGAPKGGVASSESEPWDGFRTSICVARKEGPPMSKILKIPRRQSLHDPKHLFCSLPIPMALPHTKDPPVSPKGGVCGACEGAVHSTLRGQESAPMCEVTKTRRV